MNINHLIVSGNLTRPVEYRTVGADKMVAKFTVAHNTRFKVDGEMREEVTFLDCEAWDKQAEVACQYLAQGSLVIVEGQIRQDNWVDKEGQKRSKLKLRVERLHLTPKRDGDQAAPVARTNVQPPAPVRAASASPNNDDQPPF